MGSQWEIEMGSKRMGRRAIVKMRKKTCLLKLQTVRKLKKVI